VTRIVVKEEGKRKKENKEKKKKIHPYRSPPDSFILA